jgi:predicted Zn-dependent peptidase
MPHHFTEEEIAQAKSTWGYMILEYTSSPKAMLNALAIKESLLGEDPTAPPQNLPDDVDVSSLTPEQWQSFKAYVRQSQLQEEDARVRKLALVAEAERLAVTERYPHLATIIGQ